MGAQQIKTTHYSAVVWDVRVRLFLHSPDLPRAGLRIYVVFLFRGARVKWIYISDRLLYKLSERGVRGSAVGDDPLRFQTIFVRYGDRHAFIDFINSSTHFHNK
jgi:hypothetical protein